MFRTKSILALCLVIVIAFGSQAIMAYSSKTKAEIKGNRIIEDSINIVDEVMSDPESRIPNAIFEKCYAVAIFPGVVKAGFIFGGRFGQGIIISKNQVGDWKTPIFYSMTGGSFGLQIGAKAMDIVLFFMSKEGLKALINEKTTLGLDLAVAAGPVGDVRDADIDALLQSEIISYTRARGLFAGVSVKGSVIAYNSKFTADYYGKEISKRDILLGKTEMENPRKVQKLVRELSQYSSKKKPTKSKKNRYE